MFQMLGNDFLRDPFFQDPFRHLFTQTVFPNPAQDVTPWASARLPQRRGREVVESQKMFRVSRWLLGHIGNIGCEFLQVPIESSGHLSAESAAQPGFSIEEVHDSDQVPTSRHTPVVEEPDEGKFDLHIVVWFIMTCTALQQHVCRHRTNATCRQSWESAVSRKCCDAPAPVIL